MSEKIIRKSKRVKSRRAQPGSLHPTCSDIPSGVVPGESVRDNMLRTGETDRLRSWIRLHGGHCSGGGGPC